SPDSNGIGFQNTGYSVFQAVYITVRCSGIGGDCDLPSNPSFNQIRDLVITNFTTEEKDLFWQYLVSYYLSHKQRIQHVFINLHAKRQGFYNGCIGTNNTENINLITSVISDYDSIVDQIENWFNPTSPSPVSSTLYEENGEYLQDKVKRFPPYDDLYDSTQSNEDIGESIMNLVDSQYYSQTGICPKV